MTPFQLGSPPPLQGAVRGPPRAWPQGPGLQAWPPEYGRRWKRSGGHCFRDPLLCWGARSVQSGVLAARAGLAGQVAPKPRGWGQSEGGRLAGRLAGRSSRSRKGRWGRGPRGGEQEGRRLAPTPVPAPAGQSCHRVIWPPGAAGSSPRRAGIFHPFSLALIFFFNKNNYEGSKTPFFLDIPALRSQQHVGGKECPLSLRPLAFI